MSEWIPVEERLPEDDRYVLACVNGHLHVAWYFDAIRTWCTEDVVPKKPSAWMPLPEPYGGKTMRFEKGYVYLGATQIEGCDYPAIFVTGRYDEGLHNEIKFTTNAKDRPDEMHRPIHIDCDGNEFVMAYGIMFSAKQLGDSFNRAWFNSEIGCFTAEAWMPLPEPYSEEDET